MAKQKSGSFTPNLQGLTVQEICDASGETREQIEKKLYTDGWTVEEIFLGYKLTIQRQEWKKKHREVSRVDNYIAFIKKYRGVDDCAKLAEKKPKKMLPFGKYYKPPELTGKHCDDTPQLYFYFW